MPWIFRFIDRDNSTECRAKAQLYVDPSALLKLCIYEPESAGREHTPTIGCRSLDVLHVASALELQFKKFLTFDLRQQKLARAVGLKVVIP